MKTHLLRTSLTLVSFLIFSIEIFSQIDTDGTYQTANGLVLNSIVSGNIGYKIDDQTIDWDDWYVFTLPSDGKISVIESMSSELFSGLSVYDIGGTHEFRQRYARKGGSDTLIYDNLEAGTYFVKLGGWNGSFGFYTLKVDFVPALYANDNEPNNNIISARNLSVNTETTGHIGFYKDNTVDYDDWYKFTIPSDGKIEIVQTTTSELYSGIYAYDSDGTHEFRAKYARKGNSDTLTYDNLEAGEYYLKIINWNTSYGSYKLKVNFYAAVYNNDNEPNNIKNDARTIAINTEISGHVGFYRNNMIDYEDWYKFTIPTDGKVEIVENTTPELYSGMYVFDIDGTHEFRAKYARKGNSDTLTYDNLEAGEYYIKIHNWNTSYGSYKLKVNFYAAVYNNDKEPNNINNDAGTIEINTEISGHIGFYRNNMIDYDDWYKFTIPSDGKIDIVQTTTSELYSGIYVYDNDGTHEFKSKYARKGNSDTLNYDNLEAGEYYIKIINWNVSYGSYKLKINFYAAVLNNDSEPNGTISQAKQLIFNTEATGHIGFYSNNNVDYDDWYWFLLPTSGKIKVVESVTGNLYSGINLYDSDGSKQISARYARLGMADTLIHNETLSAGIYYLKIFNWNSSYGSYSLKVSSNDPTSLADLSKDNLSLSMIPGSGRLCVNGKDIDNIQIYDLFGKVLYNSSPVSVNKSYEIDVSECSKGLYFLKIWQGGSHKTVKFMIR